MGAVSETLTAEQEGAQLKLRGPLGFATARAGLASLADRLSGVREIDLSGVTHADSAGLALLLECLKRAPAGQLRFGSPPPQLLALARAMGLASLFEGPQAD